MGIGCGVSAILSRLSFGLYKMRDLGHVVLNIDGELIRYKGMIQDNMNCHDAEAAIAKTSYEYLAALKRDIEIHINRTIDDVRVYMDGERVINKTTNRPDFKLDAAAIREIFGRYCTSNGMRMVWLESGEAELQMYLRRDKTCDLNVFVSGDSDMVSIMYGHKPTILTSDVDANAEAETLVQECRTSNDTRIRDMNRVYVNGKNVRDSCLWIKCSSPIEAYGMDDTQALMKFEPRVFRTMIALCGTDFTCSVFTETMVQLIVLASSASESAEAVRLMNAETDPLRIAAALTYLAVSYGCTLKRPPMQPILDVPELRATFNHAESMIATYLHYIESGEMLDDIVQPISIYFLRLMLFAMFDGNITLNKRILQEWTSRTSLSTALRNFENNRSQEFVHVLALASLKTILKKRKINELAAEIAKRQKLSTASLLPHVKLIDSASTQ